MTLKIMRDVRTELKSTSVDAIALILRTGLGTVFVTGGWWKLSRAINTETSAALVDKYMATNGYINGFFEQFFVYRRFGFGFDSIGLFNHAFRFRAFFRASLA